jgi:hypothetical protein
MPRYLNAHSTLISIFGNEGRSKRRPGHATADILRQKAKGADGLDDHAAGLVPPRETPVELAAEVKADTVDKCLIFSHWSLQYR